MRIILAVDGSTWSGCARDLVAALAWPPGSQVRAVAALEPIPEPVAVPWPGVAAIDLGAVEGAARSDLTSMLESTVAALRAPDRAVDCVLVTGRPGDAIVEMAGSFEADLVALGSRGQSTLESVILGSVAAEVVDRAPCPVLIARRPTVRRIVLADDGSECAAAAARVVANWHVLRGFPIHVVSVATLPATWGAGLMMAADATPADPFGDLQQDLQARHGRIAEMTGATLRAAGCEVSTAVRFGAPAAEILRAAREQDADLIVVGSRGHTGITRILLGSVARSVLLHAACSVLVVRHGVHCAQEPGTPTST